MRLGVQVREALPGDLESLVALCLAARQEAAVGSQLCTDDAERLRDQLGSAPRRSRGGRVLLALLDDEPAGLLLARVVGPGPFTDVVSLDIEAVYVLPGSPPPRARARAAGRRRRPWPRRPARPSCTRRRCPAPAACSASSPGWASRPPRRTAWSPRPPCSAGSRTSTAPGVRPALGPRGLEDLIARRRQVRAGAPAARRRAGTDRAGLGSGSAARVDHHAGEPRRADRPAVLVLDHDLVGRQASCPGAAPSPSR